MRTVCPPAEFFIDQNESPSGWAARRATRSPCALPTALKFALRSSSLACLPYSLRRGLCAAAVTLRRTRRGRSVVLRSIAGLFAGLNCRMQWRSAGREEALDGAAAAFLPALPPLPPASTAAVPPPPLRRLPPLLCCSDMRCHTPIWQSFIATIKTSTASFLSSSLRPRLKKPVRPAADQLRSAAFSPRG